MSQTYVLEGAIASGLIVVHDDLVILGCVFKASTKLGLFRMFYSSFLKWTSWAASGQAGSHFSIPNRKGSTFPYTFLRAEFPQAFFFAVLDLHSSDISGKGPP